MRKLLKAINLRFSPLASRVLTIITACALSTLLLLVIAEIFTLPKATRSYDINAGVKAATEPFVKLLDTHWGKALFFIFCGGALLRETGGFRAKKLDQDKESSP
jgi:hypothetical protein